MVVFVQSAARKVAVTTINGETVWGNFGQGRMMHDLRHIFASHAAMGKETHPMIGRMLGHTNWQPTSRYADHDDEHGLDTTGQVGAAMKRLLN